MSDVSPLRSHTLPAEDRTAPAPADPPLVVDARRLATLLCAGVRTVWKWDREGKLPPSVRIGGAVRWRLDEIYDWLSAGAPDRATWLRLRDARKRLDATMDRAEHPGQGGQSNERLVR
jgi:predicted DNA-binding transcriptional regulator AlpA